MKTSFPMRDDGYVDLSQLFSDLINSIDEGIITRNGLEWLTYELIDAHGGIELKEESE